MPSPLSSSSFAWFFSGRAISLLGSAMAPVALAFAVLDASGRPADLGIVLAANMVPHLVLLLVGGATADRFSRRAVLLIANSGSALTQGAVAGLLLTDHYSLLAVAALEFANGALNAFTTPALRGVVPDLVDTSTLQRANSLLATVRNATKILGPSIAGITVAAVGSGAAIAFDAVTFVVAAVCLSRLRVGRMPPAPAASLRSDIREGFAYFRAVAWLWPVSLAFGVVNLVQTGAWQILGPQLAAAQGGPSTWGFVLSARGVGLIVVSVVMYRLVLHRLLRASQFAGVVAALPLAALGLGAAAPWLLVTAFVGGLGSSLCAIGWDTSLQEHVPADRLSRVASLDDLVSYAAIPVGQLAVAGLSGAFGARTLCLTASAIWVAAVLVPLARPAVRDLPHRVVAPSTS